MMGSLHIWIITITILATITKTLANNNQTRNSDKINVSSKSIEDIEDDLQSQGYILPKQIFNDGKPFYVHKDPISGQFDFNAKKSGIESKYNEVVDPQEKIVLNSATPNIHDFLNLPVKYSSSKFVYPLVSSSYANLKYQGSNKNNYQQNHYIGNHKNAVVPTIKTTTLPSPTYYTTNTVRKNSTKLYPAIVSTTVPKPATTKKTTRRPTTISTTTTKPPTTTATIQTTTIPPPTKFTTKLKHSPTKKYTTPVPIAISTVSTKSPATTEKGTKYTRGYTKSTTTSTTPVTSTGNPSDQMSNIKNTSKTTTKSQESDIKITNFKTTAMTTKMPISVSSTSTKISLPTTNKPTSTTTSNALPFFPIPSNKDDIPSIFPMILDSADVYNKVNVKNEPNKISLTEVFNAFTNDNSNEQFPNNQGELMQPISPSKPSPFTLQQVTKISFPTTSTRRPYVPTVPMVTKVSTQTEKTLQLPSGNNNNEYVHYEVQQPNVMKYYPAPSMNNVVISPDQNSASFVLGSLHQAVGSNVYVGSVEKEPLFEKKRPIQFGTVINEDINQIEGQRLPQQNRPLHLPLYQEQQSSPNNILNQPTKQFQSTDGNEQQTQEMLVSSNIRFPNDNTDFVENQSNDKFFSISNTVNGHAQPVGIVQNEAAKPLVFPQNEPNFESISQNQLNNNKNNIVFQQDGTQTERPLIQKQEILRLNQHQFPNKNLPQLPEDLTPPDIPDVHQKPPQFHRQNQRRPPHIKPTNGFMYNELNRKQVGGPNLHRIHPDRPLPNILPQFRPNAKISQGHPTYNKEPGNIRVTHPKYPYTNRGIPPSFVHRRTQAVGTGQNRYPVKGAVDRPQDANRRLYTLPLPNPYYMNRQYVQRFPQQIQHPVPIRYLDNHMIGERHATSHLNHENYKFYSPESDSISSDRLPSFEENDYIVKESAPPKVIVDAPNEELLNAAQEGEKDVKLEPVITLQMMQSYKRQSPNDLSDHKTSDISDSSKGVYVVYPVSPSAQALDFPMPVKIQDGHIVRVEANGSSAEVVATDYQNTPFSVVREQPQEPILMVKNKSQSPTDKFPYPLEKPDIAYAELSKKQNYDKYDNSENLSANTVNRRNDLYSNHNYYSQSTEIPIAIAYTPTTDPNKYHLSLYQHTNTDDKYSYPNLASPIIPDIHDTQTESIAQEDFDTRGQNYEKDFMAPFYPSMSLGTVTSSPNGWSIFKGTEGNIDELVNGNNKEMINRADINTTEEAVKDNVGSKSERLQLQNQDKKEVDVKPTEKYNSDYFHPELQGGFKPIYPPGYKIRDDSSEEVELNYNKNQMLDIKLTNNKSDSIVKNPTNQKSVDSGNKQESAIATKASETTTIGIPITTSKTISTSITTNLTTGINSISSTTTTTEKPKKKKETSLASLLFGDFDDYDYEEKPENVIAKSS